MQSMDGPTIEIVKRPNGATGIAVHLHRRTAIAHWKAIAGVAE
ncbi:hypothetical protein [Mesorhizobium sp. KR9-304]